MSYDEELHRLAKERSVLQTKTVFRLIACIYLSYAGYNHLIRGHLTDPENYPKVVLFFGALFIVVAAAYAVYGARVYLRENKRLNSELQTLEAGRLQGAKVLTGGQSHEKDDEAADHDSAKTDHIPGD